MLNLSIDRSISLGKDTYLKTLWLIRCVYNSIFHSFGWAKVRRRLLSPEEGCGMQPKNRLFLMHYHGMCWIEIFYILNGQKISIRLWASKGQWPWMGSLLVRKSSGKLKRTCSKDFFSEFLLELGPMFSLPNWIKFDTYFKQLPHCFPIDMLLPVLTAVIAKSASVICK